MKTGRLACVLALCLAGGASLAGGAWLAAPGTEDYRKLARDIFQQLIEINTTDSVGSTTAAAEAMAARLRAAGFPENDVAVLGPNPRKGNLVARLRGTGARRPLLLLAHLDMVEARREDWSVDPFQFLERDSYFYGRGTSDIKDGDAILMTTLIRLKQEGFQPDRDLIVALTADEEGGTSNGVQWLLDNHRELIDAAYCVNTDGGDFQLQNGKPRMAAVQASEKLSVHFQLEVSNRGGHSSLPVPDNAIYHLANGLARLEKFQFPVDLNEVTRAFFKRMAAIETGQLAADMRAVAQPLPEPAAVARLSETPYYNALLRTTCVATRLEAGHANNALPQVARAVVNCRILPGQAPDDVRAMLVRVLGDPQIAVAYLGGQKIAAYLAGAKPMPPSPLTPELMGAVEQVTGEMWPGLPVVPTMETGGTDGSLLRPSGIPTYGISGVFIDMNDVRAHGRDERVGVQAFYDGAEFYHRLVKALSASK
jgi:acetylornithine deacetylase/succinyl-diaminopimelate desuccinylase-like protein